MKTAKHITPIALKDWVIFCAPYDENLAYGFEETIEKVTRSMGIRVARANVLVFFFYFYKQNYNCKA